MTTTWICQWPAGHGNDSTCHDTEKQAEAAAKEVVTSKRATTATVFRAEVES